eukprot:204918-Pleurochrysis_carterae.AAC.1
MHFVEGIPALPSPTPWSIYKSDDERTRNTRVDATAATSTAAAAGTHAGHANEQAVDLYPTSASAYFRVACGQLLSEAEIHPCIQQTVPNKWLRLLS